MQLFHQVTSVKTFASAGEFAEEFQLGKSDFILASKRAYQEFFAPLRLECHVEFKAKYGSSEPTDTMMDQLIEDFRRSGCSRIIAIGGGAVIDMAKILLIRDVTCAEDAFLKRIPIAKAHEFIAVPTTCGAGSEVSSVSITALTSRNTKMGLADPALFPDHAILIPQLLQSMPYDVFATSAIDALIHAAESYLSPRANVYTRLFSIKAVELIISGFKRVLSEGESARAALLEDFLVASNMAGISFANAGTGAVHAMSYPLSGKYHVTHGEANYQFFTAVFNEYHNRKPNGDIRQLESAMATALKCKEDEVYAQLQELLDRIIPRKPLSAYGMTAMDVSTFAMDVIELQQRLLNQSYIKFDQETMERIYLKLL